MEGDRLNDRCRQAPNAQEVPANFRMGGSKFFGFDVLQGRSSSPLRCKNFSVVVGHGGHEDNHPHIMQHSGGKRFVGFIVRSPFRLHDFF